MIKKILEKRERDCYKGFDDVKVFLSQYQASLEKSNTDRAIWLRQVKDSRRIYKGNYFEDENFRKLFGNFKILQKNSPVTLINHKISSFLSADIKVNVRALSAENERKAILVEKLLRDFKDKSHFIQKIELEVYIHAFYDSFACVKTGWDFNQQSDEWMSGKPYAKIIDPLNVYFDPNARRVDRSDSRFIFEIKSLPVADLNVSFPKADISEGRFFMDDGDDNKDYEGLCEICICQYKKSTSIDFRWLFNTLDGSQRTVLEKDIDALLKELKIPKEKKDLILEDDESVMLMEGVVLSKKITRNFQSVYEIIYTHDNKVLQEPTYIGDKFTYHICSFEKPVSCAYAEPEASKLKNEFEISSMFATAYLLDAVGSVRSPKVFIDPSAFKQESLDKMSGIPGVIELSPEWVMTNDDNRQPYIDVDSGKNAKKLSYAMDFVDNAQEEKAGSPEISRGITGYQSGTAIQATLSATNSGNKHYIVAITSFYESILESVKDSLLQNKRYPFAIKIKENGEEKIEWVNIDGNKDTEIKDMGDRFVCEVSVIENEEIMRSARENMAMQLVQAGKLSSRSFMEFSSIIDNPEQEVKRLNEENQVRNIATMLQKDPQLMGQMQQLIAQKQNKGSATQQPVERVQ